MVKNDVGINAVSFADVIMDNKWRKEQTKKYSSSETHVRNEYISDYS